MHTRWRSVSVPAAAACSWPSGPRVSAHYRTASLRSGSPHPTRESSTVGFALNGSFDLDAGRARLAGSTSENLEKALKIGRAAGDAFGSLLKRSREDWASVRIALGLAADLDAQGFWESVWFGLTKGWLRRQLVATGRSWPERRRWARLLA